jgi:L-asparaginase
LRTDAKENLITAIQIASLQENGLPLLLRCAFILNISCIEETERPRLMRNILRHSRHPIIRYGRIWGSFKYEKKLFLARNKGKKLEVHKALDNNVVIIKMFPGISEAVLSAILVYQV